MSAKAARKPKSTAVAVQRKGKKAESARPRQVVQPHTAKTGQKTAHAAAATGSKQARLIALLNSPAGGTLKQMMSLTGWQAHSVRGVISGILRKKLGLDVQCAKSGNNDARIYRIVTASGA
jgi:hypothetical protein